MNALIPVRRNRGLSRFGGFGDVGRLIDEFFDFDSPASRFFAESDGLRTDVKEEEGQFVVKAEMPGLNEDNLNVELEDGCLSITAEFKEENENSVRQGKYSWSRSLPNIDADKVEARLKDGICTITLPKTEASKPKRIAITK
jgi:HSP20 family protein